MAHDYAVNIGNGGFDFLSGEWIGTHPGDQTHVMCKVNGPYSASEIGVRLGDVQFNDNGGTFAPYGSNRLWCDGPGFRVTGAAALGNTPVGLFAYGNNRIPNYANPAPGAFSVSGNVMRDAAVKPADAASTLRLTASSGASMAAATAPCQPGAIAAASGTILRTAGVSAGHGSAAIQVGYLDAKGNLLASNELSLKTDVPGFQHQQIVPVQLPAPPELAILPGPLRGGGACRRHSDLGGVSGACRPIGGKPTTPHPAGVFGWRGATDGFIRAARKMPQKPQECP